MDLGVACGSNCVQCVAINTADGGRHEGISQEPGCEGRREEDESDAIMCKVAAVNGPNMFNEVGWSLSASADGRSRCIQDTHHARDAIRNDDGAITGAQDGRCRRIYTGALGKGTPRRPHQAPDRPLAHSPQKHGQSGSVMAASMVLSSPVGEFPPPPVATPSTAAHCDRCHVMRKGCVAPGIYRSVFPCAPCPPTPAKTRTRTLNTPRVLFSPPCQRSAPAPVRPLPFPLMRCAQHSF